MLKCGGIKVLMRKVFFIVFMLTVILILLSSPSYSFQYSIDNNLFAQATAYNSSYILNESWNRGFYDITGTDFITDVNKIYLWQKSRAKLGLSSPLSLWSIISPSGKYTIKSESYPMKTETNLNLSGGLPVFSYLNTLTSVNPQELNLENLPQPRFRTMIGNHTLYPKKLNLTYFLETDRISGSTSSGWMLSYPVNSKWIISSGYQLRNSETSSDILKGLEFTGEISTVYLLNSCTSITLNLQVEPGTGDVISGKYKPEVRLDFKF